MTELTVHVTKRGLAYLLGKLTGTLEATLGFREMACGATCRDDDAVDWVSVHTVEKWKEGKPIILPNCPKCSVYWDEATSTLPPPPRPIAIR